VGQKGGILVERGTLVTVGGPPSPLPGFMVYGGKMNV